MRAIANPSILIVDDDPDDLRSTFDVLSVLPVKLRVARSGAEAIAIAMGQEFAVVLLKASLAGLDGFATAVAMRSTSRMRASPIIFMTEHDESDTFEFKGYEAGAVDCLYRPISPAVLRSKVEVFRDLYQLREECRDQNRVLEEQIAQRTEEIQEAWLRAEEANSIKSEFLANMSHELRTPLTAILGFAELIEGADSVASCKGFAETIIDNGHFLLHLINDILDLAKIESGKFALEHVETRIEDVVAEVVELMEVRAEKKSLALTSEMIGPIPSAVRTDPIRLKQILVNLVGNAIKFTEEGGVKIAARLQDEAEGACRLLFEVSDTGIGIPREKFKAILEPFSQADGSTTRQFGGTGLGLSISRQLIELFGGELSIASEVGEGSTFTFSILADRSGERISSERPTDTQASEASSSNPSSIGHDLSGVSVLVVEDGADNQRLIQFILKKAGAEVTVAENGKIGFEMAVEAEAKAEPFDVVLMDMQMPIMDGYEATTLLKSQSFPRPVIALTAHAMPSDRQKCLDAGCDYFLTKPIDRRQLLNAVSLFAVDPDNCSLASELMDLS